ncbi:exodeoxyribonuclease VII large subunit [Seohaeicola saemankumensis]|uniref:exodeoxyribonuclease VII large subunit n=1 Tax=Seohaeicola saemankumensis TaxID=481181 RepID=UPI001E489971|nr:exodeoxyribonuclease VII large subunit [Seohaeicola saemankumensis]MCD1625849.1 exodeoxyribonuclease VII large subunit [Seohaeicola saemankumensis]
MSDLLDDDGPASPAGQNNPEYTVSEISGAVKRVLEGEFSHIRIRGELGRVTMPRSGHVYLDLKDDRSVLAAVIWKGVAARLTIQPEEGMEVIATGRITTFGGQSKYQLIIEDIEPAGAGALMAMLDKRRRALAAEGLFDEGRKQPIPYLPEVIGVVTSPTGAVIRDILHRLRDRFPRKVLIWPVAVQGAKSAPEVARAIAGFNALTPGGALPRPDLIIVARGGGSLEDLWGFNEEIVVRAAAASRIPLISAVGHETDTTLIDYAADRRAPTPTAAAEMAVPVRLDLLAWLDGQSGRLTRALTGGVSLRAQRLRDLSRAMPRAETLLDGPRQRLDVLSDRLPAALIRAVQLRRVALSDHAGALRPALLRRAIQSERRNLAVASERLSLDRFRTDLDRKTRDLARLSQRMSDAGQRQVKGWRQRTLELDRLRRTLGYEATLQRGYVVVRAEGGAVLTTKAEAAKARLLEIQFADGRLTVGGRATGGKESKTSGKPQTPPEQGSLL